VNIYSKISVNNKSLLLLHTKLHCFENCTIYSHELLIIIIHNSLTMRLKITLSLCFCAVLAAQAQRSQVYADYINQYKDIAIREFQRTGVPASITLSQAVVESAAGTSELALNAKNHFGIKARNNWTGSVYYLKDDDRDAQGNVVPSPFRSYLSVEDSYKDHSDFLKANKRYDICFAVTPPTDYKTWARKLLEAGYATTPNYPDILIYVIETYELYKFDSGVQPNQPMADANSEVRQGANGLIYINDVKAIYVANNMSLEQIAGRYDVPLGKLKEYNENMMSVRSDQPLNNGQVLFLQRKNRAFHGHTKFHIVKQGERMRDIAQKYGIRLYRLYTKNEMIEGTEPAIGERLILRRGWFEGWQTPQLRDASQDPVVSPIAPPTVPTVPADVTNTGGAQGNAPSGSSFPAAPPSTSGNTTTTYPSYPNSSGVVTTYPDGTTTTTYPQTTTTYPSTTTTPATTKPAPVRPTKPMSTPVKPSTATTSAPKPPAAPAKPPASTTVSRPAATPAKPAPTTTPVKPAAASSTASHHTVIQGETLYSISRKYGTSVDNIKKMNNLNSNTIGPGLVLKVK
jgi:LysM repeat protein